MFIQKKEDKEEATKDETDATAVRQITIIPKPAKQLKHVTIAEEKNVTVTIEESTEQ